MRDELSLRVYLENAAHADRGGWLELPVAPERLDGFMGGVLGVGGGGGYVVADYEPCWFGDVLGSGLEVFSVSSLNLMARCVARARDMHGRGRRHGREYVFGHAGYRRGVRGAA